MKRQIKNPSETNSSQALEAQASPPPMQLPAAPTPALDEPNEDFLRLFGVSDPKLASLLANQSIAAVKVESGAVSIEAKKRAVETAVAQQSLIGPKDGVEAMLGTQMAVTHNRAMEFLSRCATFATPDAARTYSEIANKFLRTYVAQMEALNRHRGKGNQKVTVEHINVHEGGRAVVGSFEGMNDRENRGGGGGRHGNE